jgi:hypothetical protein
MRTTHVISLIYMAVILYGVFHYVRWPGFYMPLIQ